MEEIRVLELYSGIGGMHFALTESLPKAEVITAVDISPVANAVYKHNFPNTKVMENGIEGLSIKQLNKMNFNLVLMSPPCQPFTRIGLQKDVDDPRTRSFLHFLTLLPKLKRRPSILLENVKGFETSEAYKRLCSTLDECGYHRQGFLLSPKHLGIPNARLRFFLLAKNEKFHPSVKNEDQKIWETLPLTDKELSGLYVSQIQDSPQNNTTLSEPVEKRPKMDENIDLMRQPNESVADNIQEPAKKIKDYLEEDYTESYRVPEKVKSRYMGVLDIVSSDSTNSTCFTKSYTQYAEGTGSVINLTVSENQDDKICKAKQEECDLRYFTPREVANLLGFPKDFSFPDSVTRKQRYRVLGNSLNVKVVSYLLKILMLKDANT